MSSITLKIIRVGEIEAFADDMARTQPAEGTVPISRIRARAWARNPQARPADPAMLVAFSATRCVGHLGMYPDLLLFGPRRERLFWLSAFFVHPEYRASGVGPMLLMRALALNEPLGASSPSTEAARIYQTLRFIEPPPVPYRRLSMDRLNFLGLPVRLLRRALTRNPRREQGRLDRANDRARDMTRNGLFPLIGISCGRAAGRLRLESLGEIADDFMPPPRDDSAAPQFDRGAGYFNWMLRDPWVSTDPGQSARNNPFADFKERFATEAVRLTDVADGRTVGVLVFRRALDETGLALRVLGFGGVGPAGTFPITAASLSLAHRHRPDVLEIPEELGPDLSRLTGVRWLFSRQEHRYFLHPRRGDVEMADALRRVRLRFLDGDIAFIR